MNIVLHFLGFRSGGGRTDAINLLQYLPRFYPEHNFLAVVPRGYGYDHVSVTSNCTLHLERVRYFNDVWRIFFDNLTLKKICRKFRADVLFTMCNNGPVKIWLCRHIVMIRRPQLVYPMQKYSEYKIKKSLKYKFLRWYLQKSLKHVDALILQTETMKKRALVAYDIKCPVYVIGKVVSDSIRTGNLQEEISGRQQKQIKHHHAGWKFLYLTKYYPHKNIEGACEAVCKARELGIDVVLFLTMSKKEGADCAALLKKVDIGMFSEAVVNIGPVDLADIASCYKNCDGVLMPSLLESYSATYLEAMAYERPQLVSDREFAREICGDAALYFDPLDVESIVKTIQDVTDKQDIRDRLIMEGKKQLAKFDSSWEGIARKYMSVLEGPIYETNPSKFKEW